MAYTSSLRAKSFGFGMQFKINENSLFAVLAALALVGELRDRDRRVGPCAFVPAAAVRRGRVRHGRAVRGHRLHRGVAAISGALQQEDREDRRCGPLDAVERFRAHVAGRVSARGLRGAAGRRQRRRLRDRQGRAARARERQALEGRAYRHRALARARRRRARQPTRRIASTSRSARSPTTRARLPSSTGSSSLALPSSRPCCRRPSGGAGLPELKVASMQYLFDLVRARHGDITRRRVEFTLVLSLLLHGVAMWAWIPQTPPIRPGDMSTSEDQPLSLRLVPSPQATPAPPPAVMREAPPKQATRPTPPRRAAPPPPATPPVIAVPAPAPCAAGRRRATQSSRYRGARAAAARDGRRSCVLHRRAPARARRNRARRRRPWTARAARRDRAIASNLAVVANVDRSATRRKTAAARFRSGSLEFDEAQFTFYGWNRDINRRTFQVIDVRRGSERDDQHGDRAQDHRDHPRPRDRGDFRWDSKRLGRDLMLSARP